MECGKGHRDTKDIKLACSHAVCAHIGTHAISTYVRRADTIQNPSYIYSMYSACICTYSQTSLASTPGDSPNCYSLSVVLANHID